MTPLLDTAIIDWTDCPFVEINPRKVSGTPILTGSRMPVDGIIENYLGGSPVDEIADNFEISQANIRDLLLYASKQNPAIMLRRSCSTTMCLESCAARSWGTRSKRPAR